MTSTNLEYQDVIDRVSRAVESIEEALAHVAPLAIEEIHRRAGNHVQAAEVEMRAALQRLLLAERELSLSLGPGPASDDQLERLGDLLLGLA